MTLLFAGNNPRLAPNDYGSARPEWVDIWDAEGNAAYLHTLAQEDAETPLGPIGLAKRLLGPKAILLVDSRRLLGDGKLFRVEGAYRIAVRRGLSPERLTFAVGHELAEWAYRSEQSPSLETACNLLAAALIAPRRAYHRALSEVGEDFPAIAKAFCMTETSAALRFGEVTGTPIAVLCPQSVRVRGQIDFQWPSELELRRIVRAKGCPGLRKTRFTDDPRRSALIVDMFDAA